MINARSTFYKTFNFECPDSGVIAPSCTVKLTMWRGLKTSIPTGAVVYSITKENYSGEADDVNVELARIIKDYLIATPTLISEGKNSMDGFNSMWVKSEVFYNEDPTYSETAYDAVTDLATLGYGYGDEGVNYSNETPSAFNGRIFKIKRGDVFGLPINVLSDVPVSWTSNPSNDYSGTETFSSGGISLTSLGILGLDTVYLVSDSRIEVTIDGEKTIILIDDDNKSEGETLVFINKYGCQQQISMRKERKDSMNVTRSNYESSFLQPQDAYHQINDFNVNGITSLTLDSGYVPEASNDAFKELLLSESVWLLDGAYLRPVRITSNTIDFKTRGNDKLISYTINLSYAYNEINNI